MPVLIPNTLPARRILENENIYIVGQDHTTQSYTRPVRLGILNLMPTKIVTETQLLRLLANSTLPVEVTLLHMRSHQPKNTPSEHLFRHYRTFDGIQDEWFDGFLITGAPVEHLHFEDVNYWDELGEIMAWTKSQAGSTLHICWGAQAGLYYHYDVPKYPLSAKKFGVFQHRVLVENERILHGFDDLFYAPHSRHTEVRREDILQEPELVLLSESDEAGVYIVASRDRRAHFITGHSEYDPLTLKNEYERDLKKGLPIAPPENYFPQDDPTQAPVVRWRGHANLLFSNWLKYCVNRTKLTN
jgi:homoserine O-succinyltransferase